MGGYLTKTRMTTFIKAKLMELDNQMNIDKFRVTANITEYHIILNLIFRRNIIPKFLMIGQLFHVINICNTFRPRELLSFLHFTLLYQESPLA